MKSNRESVSNMNPTYRSQKDKDLTGRQSAKVHPEDQEEKEEKKENYETNSSQLNGSRNRASV